MTSLADLQALYAASTKGEWGHGKDDRSYYIQSENFPPFKAPWIFDADETIAMLPVRRTEDAALIVALHNSWPALYSRMVALELLAKAFMVREKLEAPGQRPMCQEWDCDNFCPCKDCSIRRMPGAALRALDGIPPGKYDAADLAALSALDLGTGE